MKTRSKAAFTVSEILITTTLVGLLSTAALGFYVQSLKSGNSSEQRIELLASMRAFTNELVFNGSRSHEMILYHSIDATDRTLAKRKIVINDDTDETDDDICPTGNFAVFVYYELPKPAAQTRYRIRKLIGYYLESVDSGPPALKRLTIDLGGSPSTLTVEEILTANWSTAARQVIAPRVHPLALSDGYTDETLPQLFYKRASQNIAVCGQLLQSMSGKDTKDLNTQTRTFYFTVTVRS